MRFIILFFIMLTIIMVGSTWAGVGDVYFNSGVQKYFKGDFEGALKDLQDGYHFEAGNEKLRVFYVKVLVERGLSCYQNKDYEGAMPFLEKAKEAMPNDSKVKEMYRLVSDQLKPKVQLSGNGFKKGDGSQSPKVSGRGSHESMTELVQAFEKEQEKLIAAFVEPIREIIEKNQKTQEDMMRRTSSLAVISMVLAVGVTAFLVYLIIYRVSIKREQYLVDQQQAIMAKIFEHNALVNQVPFYTLPPSPEDGMQRVLTDERPRTKARDVEIIEAELIQDGDDELAQKLLLPFLNDRDNRVRAKSAKALFRYDKRLSLDTLKVMCESDDKWMRVSGVWALGEINEPEAGDLLLGVSEDTEYRVKQLALKGLRKLFREKEGSLSKVLKDRIETVLALAKQKDGWIL